MPPPHVITTRITVRALMRIRSPLVGFEDGRLMISIYSVFNLQFSRSEIVLFEIVQQVEDLVGRGSEPPDDLPVVGILLALKRDSRFIDDAQIFRDFLPLRVGDAKY